MNRNALIFVLGSILSFVALQWVADKFFPAPRVKPAAEASPSTSAGQASTAPQGAQVAAAAVANGKPAPASIASAKGKTVSFETGHYQVTLDSIGARITALRLKGVTHKTGDKVEPLDLVPSSDVPRFATLELPGADLAGLNWALLTPQAVDEGGEKVVRFSAKVPGMPLELTKTFRFDPALARFKLEVTARNSSAQVLNLGPLALNWGPNLGGESMSMGQFPPAAVVQLEGKIEREEAEKEQKVLGYSDPRWVAIKNHYFALGYFPQGKGWNKAEVRKLGGAKVAVALVAEGLALAPGQTVSLGVLGYAGPQEYDSLKSLGGNFQAVVQFQFYRIFDWLNPLCIGMLHVLKWFHKVTGNWGFAIILLTLLVRGVMFYPSLKSMVSMRRMQTKMAQMQPRLETIKKMYKDDASKLNSETMKLYKEYGVNPLGGCLPMLLQIPIFFSLYGTLSAAFELRGAPFLWRWTDLTAGDPTFIFPVAMGVTMFLQQKLAPVNAATMSEEQVQMQKMMLWIFPIMFTGMALFMHWPMGLLLYWTASNIFGILQQLAVNKAID
jgi:YidC/Oxa1 family membrane protein insertase